MKYGVQVYYSFLLLFQSLPLAAVITTSYGQLFACHGGLSPTIDTLEDLSKIDRYASHLHSRPLSSSPPAIDSLNQRKTLLFWMCSGLIQLAKMRSKR
jgi:diadenosine tetraphosphatase ApaH/serine/threonine PP2A family protein phosphatase